MSIRVISQKNPFSQEYNTTLYDRASILEIYIKEQIAFPIEECIIVLNDSIVTNYAVIPKENDVVIFKVVPTNERTGYAITGALAIAALAAGGAYLLGGDLLAYTITGGLYGWSLGGAIYDANNQPIKEGKAFTLAGSDNRDNQYGILPVLYGTTKYAPTYGASDYTEYVETETTISKKYVLYSYYSPTTYIVNGIEYQITHDGIIIIGVDAPFTISHTSSYNYVKIGIYDYDEYVDNGESFHGLPVLKKLLIPPDRTLTVGDIANPRTVGEKDIYLHQLYTIGYNTTIIEEIHLEDALLVERDRSNLTDVVITGKTITSNNAFVLYKRGEKILLENCANRGEYTVVSRTDDVLIVERTLITETVDCTISHLALNTTFKDVHIDFIDDKTSSSLYPHKVLESTLNYTCAEGVYQYYTTPSNVSNITLLFGFLAGLSETTSSGKAIDKSVQYRIEYKINTSNDWSEMTTITSTGQTTKPYYDIQKFEFSPIGTYNIRVKRLTEDSDDSNIHDQLTWVSAKTVPTKDGEFIDPIAIELTDDIKSMALRIKATDQISGTMSTVFVKASRWIKDYDTATATWITRASSNPASVFLDILTNSQVAQHPIAFDEAHFDLDSFIAWHEWCDATSYSFGGITYTKPVYTCNGLLEESTTVESELLKIAATGRAQFTIIDGKYTILVDKPRDAVQMFTSRNILKDSFSVTRNFDDVPDDVTIGFLNADMGYETEEIHINEEYTTTTSYSLDYVNNAAQAYDIGSYLLNNMQFQILSYQFSTAVDGLIATRGDRILLQHDAGLAAISSGRIRSYTTDGGLLSTILFDEPVEMETGKEYGITIRNGSTLIPYKLKTEAGEHYIVEIDESISEFSIDEGDLFSFGLYSKSTVDLLILNISYDDTIQASISAVPYNEAIYNTNEMPEFVSNITKRGSVPNSASISTYGDVDRTLKQVTETQTVTPVNKVFQAQPAPPYTLGDMWMNNTSLYDCIVKRTSAEIFNRADWRLRSSSTFDVLNKDTFNEVSPEHRWKQIPGNGVPYNLLASTDYTVSSGEVTKANVLVNDGTDWDSAKALSAIQVEASKASNITIDSDAETAHIGGRYNNSGYMGESYTNKVVSPDAPATQDITVTGHVVVQTYRGTVTCSYGEASYDTPLEFDSTGETLTFTMADAQYVSVTETAFIPPYVVGTFTATYDTQILINTNLTASVKIVNIPEDTTYNLSLIHI